VSERSLITLLAVEEKGTALTWCYSNGSVNALLKPHIYNTKVYNIQLKLVANKGMNDSLRVCDNG
jgi:hypothetical protein